MFLTNLYNMTYIGIGYGIETFIKNKSQANKINASKYKNVIFVTFIRFSYSKVYKEFDI